MLVAGTAILVRDAPDGYEVLLIRRPDRGSFAGAWAFPGGMIEEIDCREDEDEVDDARRAAIRETLEEVGLRAADLVTLSRWTPPIEAPKRVRTWFFLASHIHGELTPAPDEVADWQWVRPAEALSQHVNREIELFPPTWVTLSWLADATAREGILVAPAEPLFYSTHILGGLEGQIFVFEGDAEHPAGGTSRHRLQTGSRPWQYERG